MADQFEPTPLPDPIKLERVAQLVDWVEKWEWGPPATCVPLWFRGHRQRVDVLHPAFLRSNVEELFTEGRSWAACGSEWGGPIGSGECEFNKEFRRRAASFVRDPDDLVELYFLAQHYGLPTRLLDWTTNPLAALFFAVSGDLKEDGEVVVMPPRYAVDDGKCVYVVYPKWHPLVKRAMSALFGDADMPDDMPLVLYVQPDMTDFRISQQGSCFSLHTTNEPAFPEKAIVRLRVPAVAKVQLAMSLRTMGVTWISLFGDLQHLCRELFEKCGMHLPGEFDGACTRSNAASD